MKVLKIFQDSVGIFHHYPRENALWLIVGTWPYPSQLPRGKDVINDSVLFFKGAKYLTTVDIEKQAFCPD